MRLGIILTIMTSFAGLLYAAADKTDTDRDTEKIERIIEELDRELKPAPVQEQVKPSEILQKISEKMTRAEDYISRSSVYGPKNQGNNGNDQSEAINEINRLLNKTQNTQKETIEDIDRLIRSAPNIMMPPSSGGGGKPKPKPSQQDQQQPKERGKEKPKPREQQQPQPLREIPQEQQTPPSKNPAEKAYDAKGGLPDRHGTANKWGNLPPKMRDEIIQNEQEGFLPDYEEWLKQYFKTLAEE
ncbi:MAG: hypothetical protein V1701_12060 [Planctomycetota bacterium]